MIASTGGTLLPADALGLQHESGAQRHN